METATEVRSISRRVKWRNHWNVARLSLQLDGGLPLDEKGGSGPPALHSDRRICDQTAAADTDERADFAFSARCRSNRHPRDGRRNIECRRKGLRHLSRSFCRGERRPSRVSSLVAVREMIRRPLLLAILAVTTLFLGSAYAIENVEIRISELAKSTGLRIGLSAID